MFLLFYFSCVLLSSLWSAAARRLQRFIKNPHRSLKKGFSTNDEDRMEISNFPHTQGDNGLSGIVPVRSSSPTHWHKYMIVFHVSSAWNTLKNRFIWSQDCFLSSMFSVRHHRGEGICTRLLYQQLDKLMKTHSLCPQVLVNISNVTPSSGYSSLHGQ